MADLPSPRSPDPRASQSTRQLLDELDTLMQRMLALPVQNGEDVVENEEEPLPTPAPAPVVQATPPRSVNLVPVPPPALAAGKTPTTESAPAKKSKKAAAPREQPLRLAETVEPENATATAPSSPDPLVPILLKRPKKMAERRGPPLLPPSMPPRPEPLPAPRPSWLNAPPAPTVPEPHGRVMTWLLTINNSFDGLTKILGPLGRWLRAEQGRSLIGWCGLAMIIVAVIWAVLAFLG